MARDLLLEVGVHDLPAVSVAAAVSALPRLLREELRRLRVPFGDIWATGSSRRLVVGASGLAERQLDLDAELIGPPAPVAFDSRGSPTRAAANFARKAGVAVRELHVVQTSRGAYAAAKPCEKGRDTSSLLPELLVRLCKEVTSNPPAAGLPGAAPQSVPLRWLLALYGEVVVPFEIAGTVASNVSYQRSVVPSEGIVVPRANDYRTLLEARGTMLHVDERRASLRQSLSEAAHDVGGELIVDDRSLDAAAWVFEKPHVALVDIGPQIESLPDVVVGRLVARHRHAFGVRDAMGRRLSAVLVVVDAADDFDTVSRRYEDELRAQCASARQCLEMDVRLPFGQCCSMLEAVPYHPRLGSYAQKVTRLVGLVEKLGLALSHGEAERGLAHHAATLCKCDLATQLVAQFPELVGEAGRVYALGSGVAVEVADAIAQHRLPAADDDPIARSPIAALLGIADRLDTIVGCCAINIMPMGSADPLGLRSAAIGLLRTLIEHRMDLRLDDAVSLAYAEFSDVALDLTADDVAHRLRSFFEHRLRGILSQSYPASVVHACSSGSPLAPHQLALRVAAIAAAYDRGVAVPAIADDGGAELEEMAEEAPPVVGSEHD